MGSVINIPKVQIDPSSQLKDYPRIINQLQQNIIDAFNKLQSQVTGISDSSGYLEVSGGPVNFPATTVWGDANFVTITAGTWDVTLVISASENSATLTYNAYYAGISLSKGNSTNGLVNGNNVIAFPANSLSNSILEGGSISNWRQTVTVDTPVYAKVQCTYSAGTPQYYYRLSAVQVN